jgi:hypothetical protein
MKQNRMFVKIFFCFITVLCFKYKRAGAQQYDCNFKPPVVTIDFGTSHHEKNVDLSSLSNYEEVNDECPPDGHYSFVTHTNNCFNNNWNTLTEDHTPGDIDGRMMVINAAGDPGTFFINYISGLKQGTTYEFSVWLLNICWGDFGCTPSPPVIDISISSGINTIAQFETGSIPASPIPVWKKYYGTFTVPAGANVVVIKMNNIVDGGCGTDFAVDDILIKECVMQMPAVTVTPKITPVKNVVVKPSAKPAEKNNPPITVLKKNNPVILNAPGTANPATQPAVKMQNLPAIPLPVPIATRANPLIKQIETAETELLIELYDNGEIDGDTVSIYHNNQLLVAHAGISAKPVTVKIKVDKEHPHHELIMVADNLGSIPPNTSLMILTANNKRYEIFISSSEQKNAKIVIDLKEP